MLSIYVLFNRGLCIDLNVNAPTRTSQHRANPWQYPRACFSQIVDIGDIKNVGSHDPATWQIELMRVALQWSRDWFKILGHNTWNSSCNCQTYAKYVIEKLGLPYHVSVTSEQYPAMVEWGTYFQSIGEFIFARKNGHPLTPVSFEACVAPAFGE